MGDAIADISFRFYRKTPQGGVPLDLPPGYEIQLWRPGPTRILPKGLKGIAPFVWWLFHHVGVFSSLDYSVVLVYSGTSLVHRSYVFPRSFRFPFMSYSDIQIGDTFTDPEHRGIGLARAAVRFVLGHPSFRDKSVWYVVEEDNRSSIRVIESEGFELVGRGSRHSRFGLRLLGFYSIEE